LSAGEQAPYNEPGVIRMRSAFAVSLVVVCLLGLTLGAQEVATCAVQALFVSPDVDGVIEQELIALINQATSTIDMALFTFTDDQLGAAVIRAHQRGVTVRVVLDGQNANSTGSEVEKLHTAGIPVRVDSASGRFHHKFVVIDGEIVITGSYNWSNAADDANFENVVVIHCPEIAAAFTQEFERLWAFWGMAFVPPGPEPNGWCPGCTCVEKLNRATQAQYEGVYGIGPTLAARIVEYRDRIGGFAYLSQLDDVPGIGQARMEAILRYFCPELYQ